MSRREQILLIVVLAVGIVVGFYSLIYQPRVAELQALSDELEQRQARLAGMQRIAAQAEQLEQRYRQLQATIADLEAKLPTEKEVPALLVQLERLTTSLGVDLQAIRPGALEAVSAQAGQGQPQAGQGQAGQPPAGQQQARPDYFRFPIQLTFEATFSELVSLTNSLMGFPRLIAVTRISMSPRELPGLTAQADVETYVLPKEAR